MCFKRDCGNDVRSYIWWGSYWALRDSVGYGYPNNYVDVLLVQFFLNVVNAEQNGGLYLSGEHIEEDGRFGGQTWGRIKSFQRKSGGVDDGMVSAAKGDRLTSPNKGRVYTLYELNRLYIKYRRPSFMDLKMDADLPIGLVQHLTVPDLDPED